MAIAIGDQRQPNHLMNTQFESTYALLVRSEEKGRGILEAALYVALILSAIFTISQLASHPVTVPAHGLQCVACAAERAQADAQS
jgi:hypothetical protein